MNKEAFTSAVHEKIGYHAGDEIMPDGGGFYYFRWNRRQTDNNLIVGYKPNKPEVRWLVYESTKPIKLGWGPTIDAAFTKAGLS